jgi:hypothetical protein
MWCNCDFDFFHVHHLIVDIQSYLQNLLSRYKGQSKHLDFNNEILHDSFYEKRLGRDTRTRMLREIYKCVSSPNYH